MSQRQKSFSCEILILIKYSDHGVHLQRTSKIYNCYCRHWNLHIRTLQTNNTKF